MIEEQTTKESAGKSPAAYSGKLSLENLETVSAWGGASDGVSYVYRPTTVDQLYELLILAKESGRSLGLRGGGNSYGDAALNNENILLDMRRMNRILMWDPENGIIKLEPGVTISQLWQYALEDGWWPPVVTGTSKTTIGGCVAMNVHGKNAYQVGPIGDHILDFELMLPSGEIITCSRDENRELFFAAVGGFGMLGIFTAISLQLKRVYSGLLEVQTQTQPDLEGMFTYFEEYVDQSDYIVGWIDSFTRGSALGRGDVHRANYLAPGADLAPSQTLRLDNQHLTPNMFGIVPRSIIWIMMRPFMNNLGTALINMAKYQAGRLGGSKRFRQPHAAFHFLLDYVPDWKNAYGPGGLIQYQPFIPKETAHDAFADLLRLCQRRGLPNYLTVFKRHRPDEFLMTHSLDGFSLAMDFRITDDRRSRVASLARELDEIVLAAGGRFYFAKDSTLRPQVAQAYLGQNVIDQFNALKQRNDPNNLLQTDLWRRIFA
ncbi:MAG: FAD-binding oxidoreductase [Candidatus Promineifilaceae bacterium]|nr:FAD-binding oxidoreductase [Candidatus Promineifilaceae bacterium]